MMTSQQGTRVPITCEVCGAVKEVRPELARVPYCSTACREKGTRARATGYTPCAGSSQPATPLSKGSSGALCPTCRRRIGTRAGKLVRHPAPRWMGDQPTEIAPPSPGRGDEHE